MIKDIQKLTGICLLVSLCVSVTASAQSRHVIIEDEPKAHEFYSKAASETLSGLPVPRYVSLKFGKVNGRQGPTLEHSVLWQYRRRGLPLIVVAETENWRKVRDSHGEESWVRRVSLSGARTVLTKREIDLRTAPREAARIKAVAQGNVLLELGHCTETDWCKVKSEDGYKGWAPRHLLWGAEKL